MADRWHEFKSKNIGRVYADDFDELVELVDPGDGDEPALHWDRAYPSVSVSEGTFRLDRLADIRDLVEGSSRLSFLRFRWRGMLFEVNSAGVRVSGYSQNDAEAERLCSLGERLSRRPLEQPERWAWPASMVVMCALYIAYLIASWPPFVGENAGWTALGVTSSVGGAASLGVAMWRARLIRRGAWLLDLGAERPDHRWWHRITGPQQVLISVVGVVVSVVGVVLAVVLSS